MTDDSRANCSVVCQTPGRVADRVQLEYYGTKQQSFLVSEFLREVFVFLEKFCVWPLIKHAQDRGCLEF